MSIKFYLKAVPLKRKTGETLAVKRFYKLQLGQALSGSGQVVPKIDLQGEVDADVIAQNKIEYAKFEELLKSQEDKLIEQAKKTPGAEVYLPEPSKEVKPEKKHFGAVKEKVKE